MENVNVSPTRPAAPPPGPHADVAEAALPGSGEDPMAAFRSWFPLASAGRVPAVLATVGTDRSPSARWVDIVRADRGFVFFTNYGSRKGRELAANDRAALCFGAPDEGRQITVRGMVERLEDLDSDAYFGTLPRARQLLVWASDQSRPVAAASEVERRLEAAEDRFSGQEVPRSLHWGGLRLVPDELEFWRMRQNGAQDRVQFRRTQAAGEVAGQDAWETTLLAP